MAWWQKWKRIGCVPQFFIAMLLVWIGIFAYSRIAPYFGFPTESAQVTAAPTRAPFDNRRCLNDGDERIRQDHPEQDELTDDDISGVAAKCAAEKREYEESR